MLANTSSSKGYKSAVSHRRTASIQKRASLPSARDLQPKALAIRKKPLPANETIATSETIVASETIAAGEEEMSDGCSSANFYGVSDNSGDEAGPLGRPNMSENEDKLSRDMEEQYDEVTGKTTVVAGGATRKEQTEKFRADPQRLQNLRKFQRGYVRMMNRLYVDARVDHGKKGSELDDVLDWDKSGPDCPYILVPDEKGTNLKVGKGIYKEKSGKILKRAVVTKEDGSFKVIPNASS